MIYLSIKGRLGNQLFQYSFARTLQKKLGGELLIDWHYVLGAAHINNDKSFCDSLKDFNVIDYISTDSVKYKEYMNLSQRILFRYYEKNFPFDGSLSERKRFETSFQKYANRRGLLFFQNGYYDFNTERLPDNVFLDGYFESEKYFGSISSDLKNEITPKHTVLEHNRSFLKDIVSSESVCVTVRRGEDFLKSSLHNVCSVDYFIKGMDIIKGKIPDAKFFIFSNDVEWIKKNVKFKYPVFFERGNDPVWEKLRLMYSCKHFVISNSTFSWWAQFLSSNPQKIVVSPDRWYNNEVKSELLNNSSYVKIRV